MILVILGFICLSILALLVKLQNIDSTLSVLKIQLMPTNIYQQDMSKVKAMPMTEEKPKTEPSKEVKKPGANRKSRTPEQKAKASEFRKEWWAKKRAAQGTALITALSQPVK